MGSVLAPVLVMVYLDYERLGQALKQFYYLVKNTLSQYFAPIY